LAGENQQGTDTKVSHRATVEEVGLPSPDCAVIHFGDAEQRAYERLQKVMRMIDERLEI